MGASKVIYGNDHIYSGPIISGCSVNNKMITISFNKTLLYDEKVVVQEWAPWYNTSIPKPSRWSATQVLVNKKIGILLMMNMVCWKVVMDIV
eukprot:UN06292